MGFLFFGNKHKHDANTFDGAELFTGLTDWHSHILPGVDDGVQTMEESLAVLEKYEEWGVRRVWLTPHIMEDIPNTPERLRKRFAELQEAYADDRKRRLEAGDAELSANPIELNLAAENMMDNLFEERLAADDLLPITNTKDHLLVETSYFNPPMNLYEILVEMREKGYYPILAHPERYVYMTMRDYDRLKGMGVKFQMNIFSQADRYGRDVRKKVNTLLDKHYYNYVGSDLHRLAMLSWVNGTKFRSI